MELTNYWWLLIWIFIGGSILTMLFTQRQEVILGEVVTRWNMIPAILLMLPYTVWAGFRGSFVDTNAYRKLFIEAPSSLNQINEYLATVSKDKGFSVLMIFFKSIIGNSDIMFFLIIAIFQSICLVYIFRKYSSKYWISIFLFVLSTNYISWMLNGMRQFIAVCICFACTDLMLKKKYIPLIVFILIASTIHGTAIIMIPLVFIAQGKAWNKKTLFLVIGTIIAIIFISQFTGLLDMLTNGTQYEGFLESEVLKNDNGTNPIRVLVFSVPAIISFIYKNKIQKINDDVINFCTNMSIITSSMYVISMFTSGILLGRLPIYTLMYTYILLPWELDNLFNKYVSRLLYFSMIILYIGFFYYQIHYTYKLI